MFRPVVEIDGRRRLGLARRGLRLRSEVRVCERDGRRSPVKNENIFVELLVVDL